MQGLDSLINRIGAKKRLNNNNAELKMTKKDSA
ncbi:MAG: hypothetical protein ACI8RD_009201, partial [Bacillariaceae sp.]